MLTKNIFLSVGSVFLIGVNVAYAISLEGMQYQINDLESRVEWLEFAVGTSWFILSFINVGIANSKNRSGAGWWIASLFLGPLATVLLVLLSPVPEQTNDSSKKN